MRLTRLLAKNGFSGPVSQEARRVAAVGGLGRVVEDRAAQGLGLHHLAGAGLADVARAGRRR